MWKAVKTLVCGGITIAAVVLVWEICARIESQEMEPPPFEWSRLTSAQTVTAQNIIGSRSVDILRTEANSLVYLIRERDMPWYFSLERPPWLAEDGTIVLLPYEKDRVMWMTPTKLPTWFLSQNTEMTIGQFDGYLGMMAGFPRVATIVGLILAIGISFTPRPILYWLGAVTGLILLYGVLPAVIVSNPTSIMWGVGGGIALVVPGGLLLSTICSFKQWRRSTALEHAI